MIYPCGSSCSLGPWRLLWSSAASIALSSQDHMSKSKGAILSLSPLSGAAGARAGAAEAAESSRIFQPEASQKLKHFRLTAIASEGPLAMTVPFFDTGCRTGPPPNRQLYYPQAATQPLHASGRQKRCVKGSGVSERAVRRARGTVVRSWVSGQSRKIDRRPRHVGDPPRPALPPCSLPPVRMVMGMGLIILSRAFPGQAY